MAARRTLITLFHLNTAVVQLSLFVLNVAKGGNENGVSHSPTDYGVWGASRALPAGSGAEPRPKTNLVHFVAARRTLIATICLISVSLNTAVS